MPSSHEQQQQQHPPCPGDENVIVVASEEDGLMMQEEEDLPPIGRVLYKWTFWWKVVRWPLVFLITCNVVIIASLYSENRQHSIFRNARDLRREKFMLYLTLFMILTADTVLLLRAARIVEKQVEEVEQEEDSLPRRSWVSSELPTTNVFGRVSKLADAYLSQGRDLPPVSLFVNLIYLLLVLAATVATMSLSRAGFWGSVSNPESCFGGAEYADEGPFTDKKNAPNISGIPYQLQEWARHGKARPSRWGPLSGAGRGRNNVAGDGVPEKQYSRLQDGSTFFAGVNPDLFHLPRGDDQPPAKTEQMVTATPVLLRATADSTTGLEAFPDILAPSNFVDLIDFSADATATKEGKKRPPVKSFCFIGVMREGATSSGGSRRLVSLFADDDDIIDYGDSPTKLSRQKILCYKGNHDARPAFVPWKLPDNNNSGKKIISYIEGAEIDLRADPGKQDILWVRASAHEHSYQSSYSSDKLAVNIYKVDVNTMNATRVMSKSIDLTHRRIGSRQGPCQNQEKLVDTIYSVLVLSLGSYWLLKIQGISSGVSAVVLAVDILLIRLLGQSTTCFVEFAIVVAFVGALRSPQQWPEGVNWLTRDLLVWALYTVLVLLARDFFNFRFSFWKPSFLPMLAWLVVGLALDHKTFQLLGWVVGVSSLLYVVLGIWFKSRYDTHGMLVMIPVGIVAGCGLVSLGHTISKYKTYVSWYCRRVGRTLRAAAAGPQQSRSTNNTEDATMMRSLLRPEGGIPT